MYPNYSRHYINALYAILLVLVLGCDPKANMNDGDIIITPADTSTDISKGILQGYKFNKNWAISVEAGVSLLGLYTDTTGQTYAINNYGAVYSRSENQPWKRESVADDYSQFSVISGYGDDIYAAGKNSTLFHKKGATGWMRESFAGDSLWFTAIYACENEVWVACGFNGSIWHRNKAGTWEMQLIKGAPIYALHGNGNEVWALGYKSIWHKKPDTRWKEVPVTSEDVHFHTLYQYDKQIWVMGSNGSIFYNNGAEEWKKEDSGKDISNISCSYGTMDEVYAAGNNGLILHRLPGGKWKKEDCGYDDFSATCIYGHGKNMYGRVKDIWIGGNDGFIFHSNGNGIWNQEAGPTHKTMINDFSSWGDKIFAAGNFATILTRSPDNTWNKATSLMPDTPLTSIFKFGRDILVGGKNGMLYHRLPDGQWQLEDSHAGDVVFTGLLENDKSIYLIGSKGTIVRRSKTDTTWTSQVTCSADLTKIYTYEDDIWVVGNHTTILHKKEHEDTWQTINTRLSEIEFTDLYGWKGQLWALGIKDQRGFIFYKDTSNKWVRESIPDSSDHFHALYGRNDTVWAVGASSDMGSRKKTEDNYQGAIIFKEGNKPWEKQMGNFAGVHFYTINGQGNDIYALGNRGNVYHKKGNSEWKKEETYQTNEYLTKLFFFKGLVMLSNDGFLYRENEDKNYIRINHTGKLVNVVAMDDDLYCAGNVSIYKITPTQNKYPVADKVWYTVKPLISPSSIDLHFIVQRPKEAKTGDDYLVEIYARPYNETYNESKWERYSGGTFSFKVTDKVDYALISTNMEVANTLRVIPEQESANKICLRVDITTREGLAQESFILKDSDGKPFITLSHNFWLDNKAWITPIVVIILYYAIWFGIWFFKPLFFLRIYHANILQQLISLHPGLQWLMPIVDVILPLRILVDTTHVKNAWIMAFAPTVEKKFNESEITQLRSTYVPLPVIEDDTLVEKPDENILYKLFNNKRSIIQIIGTGGAGKTSLAVQIGKWIIASTSGKKTGWLPRLPILLETDTTDLLKEITRMLRSWQNDYAIREDFVKILLKHQRLVIIVDSLSERPVAIQEYFKKLHGDTPVNALIITARKLVNLQVGSRYLYPSALNSNNLLYFITTYLNAFKNHPLQQSREQLAFAEKIVSIIEGNNNRPPARPILVKLIIDIALKKDGNDERDFQTILNEMPDSIPDVYYQYLVHLNPKLKTAVNYMPRQELLKIAELLGRLSLGNNFLPQDFSEDTARKEISQLYANISGDPVQNFIDNEILTRRESLATSYLRFNIDTLAEYLGASKLYDDNNTSPEQLLAFTARINSLGEEAKEFKIVFNQIREYKMKHG